MCQYSKKRLSTKYSIGLLCGLPGGEGVYLGLMSSLQVQCVRKSVNYELVASSATTGRQTVSQLVSLSTPMTACDVLYLAKA